MQKRKTWVYIVLAIIVFVVCINITDIREKASFILDDQRVNITKSIFSEDARTNYIRKIEGFIGIYAILLAIVVFMENKNPSKTIAWIMVLILLPVVGFIFYLFLGQDVRKKKMFKRKRRQDFLYLEQASKIQREALKDKDFFKEKKNVIKRKLIRLLLNNSKTPFTINNRLEVLVNGKEKFESIIESLKKAEHHIHLEYFILKDDHIGGVIKEILKEKARAGITVRVIYDSVGSWRLSRRYLKEMRNAGVQIYGFAPVFLPLLSRKLNYRNHRKIIVIDGKTGFLGGFNIGDEYLGNDAYLGFWRDAHLKIEGESVYELQNIFLMDWLFVTQKEVESIDPYFPRMSYCGDKTIQVAASGPDSDWQAIMQAYFAIISSAEERIWINTPYLVPGESVMVALKTAALSGIDVRIIIPDKPDHKMVFWASMSNVEELLKAGVKVYQYTKGFMHSKILLLDGVVASVGTANLDVRSFRINFEVNAFIYDQEIVNKMEKDFLEDIEDSNEIISEEHLKRSMLCKVKESTGRLFSPLL